MRPTRQLWCALAVAALARVVAAQPITHASPNARREAALPAVSSMRNASDAATLVRRLLFLDEEDDGVTLGDSLVRRYPASERLGESGARWTPRTRRFDCLATRHSIA